MQECGDAMFKTTDQQPAAVSKTAAATHATHVVPTASEAKQAGSIRDCWSWVEPAVWTERMLTALEQGVQGGVWFSLMDKVYSQGNLQAAWKRVHANQGAAGVDHVSVTQYQEHVFENLSRVADELRRGVYVPQAIRRHWIPKPGSTEERPLGIPTVRDRIVQTGLRNVLEPIFERDFATHSYGFRPGRGCKDALRRVDELLKAGFIYVVDADLKSYFDTIDHERLMALVRRKISDGRVLGLVEAFLRQGVLDGLSAWTPEQGTPQGAVISPLLANIYLDPLDHLMAEKGFAMVRYADDFVILCRSAEEATNALGVVQTWVAEAGLVLHPTKTRVVTAADGFDFLGYHFRGLKHWPRKKSEKKLKDAIREKTRRTAGRALGCIIADVNRTLIGWFGYFQHSVPSTFRTLDGWIRMRLRSILRRRLGKKGRGHGSDHQRWPNAFFAARGYYSLVAAHARARRSLGPQTGEPDAGEPPVRFGGRGC
jgi:RNA-directed DNA polymerase